MAASRKQLKYVHYANGVRRTAVPDRRGSYRIRYIDPRDQSDQEARRVGLADAEALCQELARGIPKAARSRDDERNVEDLCELYLSPASRETRWSANYLTRNRSTIDVRIRPRFGSILLDDFTRADAIAWINELREEGLADTTTAGMYAVLKAMFNVAVAHDWVKASPVATLSAGRTINATRIAGESARFLDPSAVPTHDYIAELADAFRGWDRCEDWCWLTVWLGAHSGLRIAEVTGLRPCDLRLEDGEIDVSQQVIASGALTLPKYRKSRTTVAPYNVLEDLAAHAAKQRDPYGPLFPGRNGEWVRGNTFSSARVARAREKTDWPIDRETGRYRWSFHSLRHYFCTWALAPSPDGLGLEVTDVSTLAGHATPSFTYDRYVSRRAGTLRRASAAAAAAAARSAA